MIHFLFALTLLVNVVSAGAIEVTVMDADLGLPLEGVRVTGGGVEAITDHEGRVVLNLPSGRHRLTFSLPGYDRLRVTVDASQTHLKAELRMAGILQGEELVVERPAPRTSDAESGVSVALGQEEFRTTAQIGIVEDVLTSFKTLPGVGYGGGWDAMPSIRGGSPLDTTFVMDGFEVLYPYHWDGAFSIFNPNMVAAAKLSAGLVSARYGRMLSGMIEISTRHSEKGETRFDGSLTTTGLDLYLETALGNDMGFIMGGKMTWMEVGFALARRQAGPVDRVPYIYSGFGKWSWDASETFKVGVTGFLGLDGLRTRLDSADGFPVTTGSIDQTNLTTFGVADLRWLMSEHWQLTFTGGYGYRHSRSMMEQSSMGSRAFSPAFLNKYDNDGVFDLDPTPGLINGSTSFSVDGTYLRANMANTDHNAQFRLDAAFTPTRGQSFQFGYDGLFRHYTEDQTGSGNQDFEQGGLNLFVPVKFASKTKGNKIINNAVYGLYAWGTPRDFFSGELGLRVDHTYLWTDGYDLQTWPVANPRLRLSFQPVTDGDILQRWGVTVGGGLFSKFPYFARQIRREHGIRDFRMGPDRNWMALAGTDFSLEGGWRLTLEGYVRNYLQRVYLTSVPETNPVQTEVQHDGQGWVWGFDALLHKTEGRFFAGYLTYTFVVTRLRNPSGQGDVTQFVGEPLERWFYPSYHRFHSLSLVANIKPWDFLTLSIVGRLATGAPKYKLGNLEVFAARDAGGQVLERWRQTSSYSDTLRNDLSVPVDIKALYSFYFTGTKVRFESYIGVQNVFAFLYTPKTNKAIDPWTGKELPGSGEADFTIGMPIPSVGVRVSY